MPEEQKQISFPKRALVIIAHPDDPEFFCGGTLALWGEHGTEIYIAILTDGGRGSSDPEMTTELLVPLRQKEQRAASALQGVKEIFFFDHPDGFLEPSLQVRAEVVRIIRQVRPDAVVCLDPTNRITGENSFNHPDHIAAGQVVMDALKAAVGSHLFYPELIAEGLHPHRIKELYLTGPANPNFEVDITSVIDKKIAALREHKSQIPDMEKMERRHRDQRCEILPDGSKRWVEKFRRFVFE
jgi:LmbE family N-acetylglucosaminyl deacetylase